MYRLIAVLLLFPAAARAADKNVVNPLFRQLVERGVETGTQGQSVRLPEASLPEGLSGPEQTQIITRLVSKKYPYDGFVRKSPVAPFLLEIRSSAKTSGKAATNAGRVQQVDLWFVAYGRVQTVSDKDLMGQLAGGNSSSHARSEPLTGDELRKRELQVRDADGFQESYFRIELPVLEKVQVRGIVHAATTRGPGVAVAAAVLDPNLAEDADYPSRWRPIVRSASGEPKPGEPQPYAGLGGYCQATELLEPAGAMFIECHLIFDEPHGWFHGTNLLGAKLPLVVQDSVRTFRRKLVEAK